MKDTNSQEKKKASSLTQYLHYLMLSKVWFPEFQVLRVHENHQEGVKIKGEVIKSI